MDKFLSIMNNDEMLFLTGAIIVCFGLIVFLIAIALKNNEYNRKQIKKQLEEMKPIENVEPKALENVLEEMEKNLDKKEEYTTSFEEEQEDKAIISYQELLNTVKSNNVIKVDLDKVQEDDYVEELSFDENDIFDDQTDPTNLVEAITSNKDSVINNDTVYTALEETLKPIDKNEQLNLPKFKKTEFISPVFGRLENDVDYQAIYNPINEEKEPINSINKNAVKEDVYTKNIEITNSIIEEIKKNDAFLESLKEFRKNLE